ncbi:response regulator transcription factor [Nitrosarchaeum koreense]|uniref:Response regulator receiver protein n=1 Tax=Nitrosarchaeum koreense MY1 TaxID=1001994 RepID=F9CX59_9ARCH|nr:response regulator [Nitrosarchaeum koreense]EGP93861.1 Response regulator receiver protein [Nitrosarchaeum koreense MY1]
MNGSVILIDDDEDILELLSEYLLLEDFNIMGTGTDGLQAVNLYTKLKPDFVLMDIAMPNYDGLYGLEHIKKIDSNASVIVLTGNSDKSITQKIMQLKPTMVLEKPYPVEKLVSLLKSIKNPIPS